MGTIPTTTAAVTTDSGGWDDDHKVGLPTVRLLAARSAPRQAERPSIGISTVQLRLERAGSAGSVAAGTPPGRRTLSAAAAAAVAPVFDTATASATSAGEGTPSTSVAEFFCGRAPSLRALQQQRQRQLRTQQQQTECSEGTWTPNVSLWPAPPPAPAAPPTPQCGGVRSRARSAARPTVPPSRFLAPTQHEASRPRDRRRPRHHLRGCSLTIEPMKATLRLPPKLLSRPPPAIASLPPAPARRAQRALHGGCRASRPSPRAGWLHRARAPPVTGGAQ